MKGTLSDLFEGKTMEGIEKKLREKGMSLEEIEAGNGGLKWI